MWVRIKNFECKCNKWSLSNVIGLSTDDYMWKKIGESDWKVCDLLKTPTGKKLYKYVASSIRVDNIVFMMTVSAVDKVNILTDCAKIAMEDEDE